MVRLKWLLHRVDILYHEKKIFLVEIWLIFRIFIGVYVKISKNDFSIFEKHWNLSTGFQALDIIFALNAVIRNEKSLKIAFIYGGS